MFHRSLNSKAPFGYTYNADANHQDENIRLETVRTIASKAEKKPVTMYVVRYQDGYYFSYIISNYDGGDITVIEWSALDSNSIINVYEGATAEKIAKRKTIG